MVHIRVFFNINWSEAQQQIDYSQQKPSTIH